ncbi:MAG: redox-regulated ATPase YchF [Planctomycetota bacterium]|nr:MAG: redox-regulated ATPase YchF [Planctomycetota bacterium]
MSCNCGIVGLPNVGKSTLFNALTQTQAAQAANYPFCTIDPNSGMVAVPDERLATLAEIVKTSTIIPTQIEIVDIAGLVNGAAQGAGRGNAFLSDIKGVDAIIHVVRCFDDDDVIHVDGSIDPLRDIEVIDLELLAKDADTVAKSLERNRKRANHDKEAAAMVAACEKLQAGFEQLTPVRSQDLNESDLATIRELQLITAKPMLFVCNVRDDDLAEDGNAYSAIVAEHAAKNGGKHLVICSKIEEELVALEPDERLAFMQDLGIQEPGLDRLLRAAYDLLGLATYFTAGVKEVRAWTIRRGWKAPQAAGVIHTDFEKGFIRAEVASYDDFIAHRGEKGCRDAGRLRSEGKEYLVADGDVMHFLFN